MDNLVQERNFNFQRDKYMSDKNIQEFLSAGVHFGHPTSRWNPNFKKYIAMKKNGIHIIDLQSTISCLEKASAEISKLVRSGGNILFVGTKKQAKDVIQQQADRCGMFYVVERWLGGTLTNFSTIKKSIKRLHSLEKEGSSIFEDLTKKELLMLNREKIKLSDQHRGIKDMKKLPNAIVIVDGKTESIAIQEAKKLEIPIICIVDSNTDPSLCDYPIPANDDSIRTIQLIVNEIVNTIISVSKKDDDKSEFASDIKEQKEE